MAIISKEQLLAMARGFIRQNLGATTTQTFTPPSPSSLYQSFVFSDTTQAALNTANAIVTVTSTANYRAGMPIARISGTSAFFNGSPLCVHEVLNETTFNVGNFPKEVITNVTATLETATNVVTITSNHTTRNLVVGMLCTKISGTGAFNATGPYIKAITGEKTFTVVTTIDTSSVPGATVANHATAGDIVFRVGGITRNSATAGLAGMVFAVNGGINLTNNQIPGTGDPGHQLLTLAKVTDTLSGNVIYVTGGDISNDGTLSNVEKDYHYTGRMLIRKLK